MIIDKSYIATAETLGLGQVCPCWRVTTFDGTHEEYCPIYRVAVALASAAADQRERDTQVCDAMAGGHYMAKLCASAIRAQSDQRL